MSCTVRILCLVIASCASTGERDADSVPTPFPEGDPALQFEAQQLDAAQRAATPERFQQMYDAACERLDDRLNKWDSVEDWAILYLAEWHALRAVRFGDRKDWESAVQFYEAIEALFGGWENEDSRRVVAAARVRRKRMEARLPPLSSTAVSTE